MTGSAMPAPARPRTKFLRVVMGGSGVGFMNYTDLRERTATTRLCRGFHGELPAGLNGLILQNLFTAPRSAPPRRRSRRCTRAVPRGACHGPPFTRTATRCRPGGSAISASHASPIRVSGTGAQSEKVPATSTDDESSATTRTSSSAPLDFCVRVAYDTPRDIACAAGRFQRHQRDAKHRGRDLHVRNAAHGIGQ